MANASDHALAIAVADAGGIGAIPCATLSPAQVHAEVAAFRGAVQAPINLNFFCHTPAEDPARLARWWTRLLPYYAELGIDPDAPRPPAPSRMPFDTGMCEVVEALRPELVSFHFGLPDAALLARVRATGAKILGTATTVDEARWLDARGVDAVIAQGSEAGGHRGMFLDHGAGDVARQVGTFALVPLVVDAVRVPVIAAGGIADARDVAAALALGATGVQIGTAFLRCPEAKTSALFRATLAAPHTTVITNVLTGRPARAIANRAVCELGPIDRDVPPFPTAAAPLLPLRAAAEARGLHDFSPFLAGQAGALAREVSAREITAGLIRGLDRNRRP
jgi:nitronate monooxygenase